MKKILLIFLILFVNLGLFSQSNKDLYFNDIEETVWQSSENIEKEAVFELKNFGLSLIEKNADSLKSNSILWTFNETLVVESLDSTSKQRALIFECEYVHNQKNRTLKLLFENRELEFQYVPVSTGFYIGFTRTMKSDD